MDLFNKPIDWKEELLPILEKYRDKIHPLEYRNIYQLLIMTILSAQDSDDNINKIALAFFNKFPDLLSLAQSDTKEINIFILDIKYHKNKALWIFNIAKKIKNESHITLILKELTSLKVVGRKTANVIIREAKVTLGGIMVDLHVLSVAPRIGIIKPTKDGSKAEKDLMAVLPREIWNDIGMCISFLGREICRPHPKCYEYPIKYCCQYAMKQ